MKILVFKLVLILKKVQTTIEAFNLNCDRLCLARKTVLEKLEEDYECELAYLGENPSDEQIKLALEKMAKYNLVVNQDGTLQAFFSTIQIFFYQLVSLCLLNLLKTGYRI
ncbi:hypothetical protein BGP_2345 [Beggiatoa sp. PS]|nr:hypothetical protein BGP_2345 [Beggiatoa sp. PS]